MENLMKLFNTTSNNLVELRAGDFYNLALYAPLAISIFKGPDLCLTFINQATLSLGGNLNSIGKPFKVLFPELADSEIQRSYFKVLETGKPITLKTISFTKDFGNKKVETKYFDLTIQPSFDANDTIVGVCSFAFEVTSQVIACQNIKDSQIREKTARDQLDVILHSVSDGITVLDKNNKFIFANEAGAKMCGYSTVEAFLKAPTCEVMGQFEIFNEKGEPLSPILLPGYQVLQGTEKPDEMVIQFKNKNKNEKNIRWAMISARPIFNNLGSVEFSISIFKDFTARKKAEELILQSANQLSLITNTLPSLISYIDIDQRYTFNNKAYENWFGIKQKNLFGKKIIDVLGEENFQKVEANVSTVLSGTPVSFEYWINYPRIGKRFIQGTYTPDKDDNGNVRGFIGLINDYTIQKRKEDAAKFLSEASAIFASSLNYDSTLNSVANLAVQSLCDWCSIDIVGENGENPRQVCVAHTDPKKLQWAEKYRQAYPMDWSTNTGLPQVIKTGVSQLYPKITEEQLCEAAKDEYHLKLLRQLEMKSLMIVPLQARGRTIGAISMIATQSHREFTKEELSFAEELGRRAGISVDNSRLFKQAQKAIESRDESLEVLRTINQVNQKISGELNLERLVQSVTDAATKLSRAQIGAFFYNVTNPKGQSYTLYSISGVAKSLFEKFPMPRKTEIFKPTFEGTAIVRSSNITKHPNFGKNEPYFGMPSGHLKVKSYLAVPVISRTGEIIGGLFFGHPNENIFSEKEEEIVIGLASQAAVAIDNARLFQQSQEAVKARDEFLSIASHELKTPLTSLKLRAQIRKRAISKGDYSHFSHEKLKPMIQDDERQINRITQLVDDMLDISRIRTGKLALNPEEFDICDVVEETIERFLPLVESTGSTIKLKITEQIFGSWDKFRIEQIITNLLTNAVKYGRGNPISVEINRNKTHVKISMEDGGIGIKPEDTDRIFEQFERAVPLEDISGFGLGLFIVRQLVQAHKGNVSVVSDFGTGSTFTIELPIQTPTS